MLRAKCEVGAGRFGGEGGNASAKGRVEERGAYAEKGRKRISEEGRGGKKSPIKRKEAEVAASSSAEIRLDFGVPQKWADEDFFWQLLAPGCSWVRARRGVRRALATHLEHADAVPRENLERDRVRLVRAARGDAPVEQRRRGRESRAPRRRPRARPFRGTFSPAKRRAGAARRGAPRPGGAEARPSRERERRSDHRAARERAAGSRETAGLEPRGGVAGAARRLLRRM